MSYNFDVIFDSEERANEVLGKMRYIAEEYGRVTLADLYELADLDRANYLDNKSWWMEGSLKHAYVTQYRAGWAIELPAPICDRSAANGCYPSYRYRNHKPTPKPEPKPITITVNTETVDSVEEVMADVFKYAHTITDRPVYISII